MSILRTSIEVALRRERSAEEYRQLATGCLAEIERVQRTVEGLLTLARDAPEEERFTPVQPVCLSAVAAAAAAAVAPLAGERGVVLETAVAPEVWVRGESDRLRLALVNLLDNAIRHTPAGRRVSLALTLAGGRARVMVADQGSGVARGDRPFIFDRFYRGGADRGAPGAGGLGLAVVRWVVENHRGSVRLVDREGPGAVFEMLLPLLPAGADAGSSSAVHPECDNRVAAAAAGGGS